MISGRLRIFYLTTVIFYVLATAKAPGQSCNLKLNQLPNAPELYGFQLGMTAEEAKTRVPLIMFGRPDPFGVMKTSINPSYDPRFDQAAFAGVRTVSFDFLDGRLVTLWIGYDERFKWQTVDDFIAGIKKSLNLSGPWMPKRGGKESTCDGFTIFVSMIAQSPSLRITDDSAQETIATRREEAAAAAETAVVGDRQTKLYYPSDCEAAEAVPVPNRVTFKDRNEAEKGGYKLAKDCQ
jgi:hypothetical protein